MYLVVKRFFDIALSLAGIILLLPAMLLIWVFIKTESKGPGIFKQTRAGINGKPFEFHKFRTMRTDVDPYGPSPKSGQDSRITQIGKFLREYSLDELPQLFNVLKGNMSLVGPRPLYVSQIEEWDQNQKRRLLAKPGLTGLAQISGRGELTREEKLDFDVKYVDSAGIWTDTKIIYQTFLIVIARKSIYEKNYSKTQSTRGEN
jgi:lipopolysaccharide/colanic/teichoic acid biosynthesis glycosyltransferase